MDRLREALGDEQLTYLGYSYGTTLGSTYAELFPDKVRALVLDAAVDPDATEQEDAEASAAAFEKGFDAFAANCTGLIAGCPLGADPRAFVETSCWPRPRDAPIPSSEEGETRQATPGVVLTAVQAALYDTDSWPQLAQALAAAQRRRLRRPVLPGRQLHRPARGRHLLQPARRQHRDQLRRHRRDLRARARSATSPPSGSRSTRCSAPARR